MGLGAEDTLEKYDPLERGGGPQKRPVGSFQVIEQKGFFWS
jgi:hypothetical protein